jgi:glycosyltransferase involved in cell wall biosynthesis
MILGLDASNIRVGGGLVHLVEILKYIEAYDKRFSQIIIWGNKNTLSQIKKNEKLILCHEPFLDRSIFFRLFWQRFTLPRRIKNSQIDILFVPGGTYLGRFKPFVTMSQNLLPFEIEEIKRYKFSFQWLRLFLLRYSQSKTFKSSNGIIFLTEFAKARVFETVDLSHVESIVIPHGIDYRFNGFVKKQEPLESFTIKNPIKILYVSTIDKYKHQDKLVEAIGLLRAKGYPVEIEFVGSSYPPSFRKLRKMIRKNDPNNSYIKYTDSIPHQDLVTKYKEADIFVFASSCETFGQIVTEAMSAGLPIVCSELSSMKEILQDSAIYFNPLDVVSISEALTKAINSPVLRKSMADKGLKYSKKYTWKNTSYSTFQFIDKIYFSWSKKMQKRKSHQSCLKNPLY